MEETSIDLYVDESYLLALINDEPIPISDEKFALELQLQEALVNSTSFPLLSHTTEDENQTKNTENRAFEAGESSSSNLHEYFLSPSLSKPEGENKIIIPENGAFELGESSSIKLQETLPSFPLLHSIPNIENRVLDLGESSSSKLPESLYTFSSVQLQEEKPTYNPEKRAFESCQSPHIKLLFCGICMESKETSEMFEGLSKCHHSFCVDCIAKYVASKIKEKSISVECPDPGCNQVLELGDCGSILPKEVFERWESALFEATVLGSQKFYCPFKDCSVLMVDDGEEEVTRSECPHCHRLFCARCQVVWHEGITCEEFERLEKEERQKEDIMLLRLAKDKQWRRCSNCRFYVEKNEGCLHMVCRCRYEFCYKCGDQWSNTHAC